MLTRRLITIFHKHRSITTARLCTRGARVLLLLLSYLLMTVLTVQFVRASNVSYQTGDVLAGVGNGKIKHFSSTGILLDTLDTGAGSTEDTGMAFDAAGNLYATVFQANNLYRFDNKGNLLGTFGGGYNQDPESIVFDKNGNAYVGQADGSAQILEFSSTGALVSSFSPDREERGTDWIDLAADQCTMHYTSEGSSIKLFNVCTNTQLADFATGLSGSCYGHRIRPNFEELVACTTQVYRLSSTGAVIQTYHLPGTSLLFALNLDPDNKSFWTADIFNGEVFRVDISTGSIITQFNAGIFVSLAGLTVVGELTAATTVPPSTTSYYVRTTDSKTLRDQGALLAQAQIATGTAQDNVVALLFGGPTFDAVSQAYGASLWGHQSTVSDIASLAQDFIIGYYNALGTHTNLHVRLVLATSNSGKNVTSNHGKAWAQMVNSVASWVIAQGYVAQVDIAGGTNIELGFNAFAATSNWVNGYASVTPNRFLYDLGAAEGCPPFGSCNNGWTQDNLWFVSWGAVPSLPLPEIYNSANAKQWQNLSLFGFQHHNQSVIILGALTEQGACTQYPNDPTCNPTAFTPAQGWQTLFNTLNKDSRTAQTLPWSTDIQWLDKEK